MIGGIPVHVTPHAATRYDDGRPRLFTFVRDPRIGGPMVLVHPSRYDEFQRAIDAYNLKKES